MAFPLLKLLPGILKAVARLTGLPLGEAADALQQAKFTPEQEVSLQQELQRHEVAMKQLSVDELKAVVSESLAMVTSEDAYVRRARPTGLYLFYGISAALALGMLFGKQIDSSAILAILTPLAGVGGTYVYGRTREKLNGGGRE